jgi:1-aminocyclopropane-1-carboxylate deaminase
MYERPADVGILNRLTAKLSCGATFWIKRDDSNSGLAGGGNKIRKLEYVLADALSQGADTLVTTGGIQSNHMRQTSSAAAHLGLNVRHKFNNPSHFVVGIRMIGEGGQTLIL